MYFCFSFLCGNSKYSSFCPERLWFKTWTWLFEIWMCSHNSPWLCLYCIYIMDIHIHMPGSVCMGGWMVVGSFHSWSTPRLWAHLPASGFLWSESNCVAWSLSGSDQTTGLQKQSSASLCWPFQQWCNVPSHPYKGGAAARRGEEGCHWRLCGCGF